MSKDLTTITLEDLFASLANKNEEEIQQYFIDLIGDEGLPALIKQIQSLIKKKSLADKRKQRVGSSKVSTVAKSSRVSATKKTSESQPTKSEEQVVPESKVPDATLKKKNDSIAAIEKSVQKLEKAREFKIPYEIDWSFLESDSFLQKTAVEQRNFITKYVKYMTTIYDFLYKESKDEAAKIHIMENVTKVQVQLDISNSVKDDSGIGFKYNMVEYKDKVIKVTVNMDNVNDNIGPIDKKILRWINLDIVRDLKKVEKAIQDCQANWKQRTNSDVEIEIDYSFMEDDAFKNLDQKKQSDILQKLVSGKLNKLIKDPLDTMGRGFEFQPVLAGIGKQVQKVHFEFDTSNSVNDEVEPSFYKVELYDGVLSIVCNFDQANKTFENGFQKMDHIFGFEAFIMKSKINGWISRWEKESFGKSNVMEVDFSFLEDPNYLNLDKQTKDNCVLKLYFLCQTLLKVASTITRSASNSLEKIHKFIVRVDPENSIQSSTSPAYCDMVHEDGCLTFTCNLDSLEAANSADLKPKIFNAMEDTKALFSSFEVLQKNIGHPGIREISIKYDRLDDAPPGLDAAMYNLVSLIAFVMSRVACNDALKQEILKISKIVIWPSRIERDTCTVKGNTLDISLKLDGFNHYIESIPEKKLFNQSLRFFYMFARCFNQWVPIVAFASGNLFELQSKLAKIIGHQIQLEFDENSILNSEEYISRGDEDRRKWFFIEHITDALLSQSIGHKTDSFIHLLESDPEVLKIAKEKLKKIAVKLIGGRDCRVEWEKDTLQFLIPSESESWRHYVNINNEGRSISEYEWQQHFGASHALIGHTVAKMTQKNLEHIQNKIDEQIGKHLPIQIDWKELFECPEFKKKEYNKRLELCEWFSKQGLETLLYGLDGGYKNTLSAWVQQCDKVKQIIKAKVAAIQFTFTKDAKFSDGEYELKLNGDKLVAIFSASEFCHRDCRRYSKFGLKLDAIWKEFRQYRTEQALSTWNFEPVEKELKEEFGKSIKVTLNRDKYLNLPEMASNEEYAHHIEQIGTYPYKAICGPEGLIELAKRNFKAKNEIVKTVDSIYIEVDYEQSIPNAGTYHAEKCYHCQMRNSELFVRINYNIAQVGIGNNCEWIFDKDSAEKQELRKAEEYRRRVEEERLEIQKEILRKEQEKVDIQKKTYHYLKYGW